MCTRANNENRECFEPRKENPRTQKKRETTAQCNQKEKCRITGETVKRRGKKPYTL